MCHLISELSPIFELQEEGKILLFLLAECDPWNNPVKKQAFLGIISMI
jgi:hypothetical protein